MSGLPDELFIVDAWTRLKPYKTRKGLEGWGEVRGDNVAVYRLDEEATAALRVELEATRDEREAARVTNVEMTYIEAAMRQRNPELGPLSFLSPETMKEARRRQLDLASNEVDGGVSISPSKENLGFLVKFLEECLQGPEIAEEER